MLYPSMIDRFQRYEYGIYGNYGNFLMGSDKYEGDYLNDLQKGFQGRLGSQDEIYP